MSDTKNELLLYSFEDKLQIGLHCKACDAPLSATNLDPELCTECLGWVLDYNSDLDKPDDRLEDYIEEEEVEPMQQVEQLPFFVYGTLREGMGNHRIIERVVEKITPTKIKGILTYEGGLPWVYKGTGTDREVTGELVEVSPSNWEDALRALDRLEGHPHLYERTRTTTTDGVDCWAYMVAGNVPVEKIVKDGDFVKLMRG